MSDWVNESLFQDSSIQNKLSIILRIKQLQRTDHSKTKEIHISVKSSLCIKRNVDNSAPPFLCMILILGSRDMNLYCTDE